MPKTPSNQHSCQLRVCFEKETFAPKIGPAPYELRTEFLDRVLHWVLLRKKADGTEVELCPPGTTARLQALQQAVEQAHIEFVYLIPQLQGWGRTTGGLEVVLKALEAALQPIAADSNPARDDVTPAEVQDHAV